jgi:hypothetical protein
VDLDALLERVSDRTSFLTFVRALASDAQAGGGWEHATIGDYLEAMAAWVEDSAGLDPSREHGSWQALARLLYAGKIYE